MNPTIIQMIAAGIFSLAIIHIFSTKFFEKLAHKSPNHSGLYHLLGEIEVVFGVWALILILVMFALKGKVDTIQYVESRNFTEPMFVFVIMVIAATRPILQTVILFVRKTSNLIKIKGSIGFYFVVMAIVPLTGSFITEPAAMTLAALILSDKLFSQEISNRLKYATLGVLFVNISIGGTLTNFAAPPILMVAAKWEWTSAFMLAEFGWKAVVAILINTIGAIAIFHKELANINIKTTVSEREDMPFTITLTHFLFLTAVIVFAHYPAIFMSIFLFFLGVTHAYQKYQDRLMLREGLLVAFFLAGLVVLGGQQQWWLQSILMSLSNVEVFFGALALGPFTDNAAITYLGSLIDGLSPEFKYALVAGAVTSGGLTVIANAPNPAGVSILKNHFDQGTVEPLKLFISSLLPTIVAGSCFMLL